MGVVNLHRRQHEDPEATGRQLVEIVTLVPLSDMMSRGIIALLIVLTVLAWVTSGLRVYTKHRFLQYTIDDWLMFITIGLYTTMMGTLIIAVYFVLFGLETATLATMSKITNMLLVVESTYTWALLFFKFSLVMFFRPIMTFRWQRIFLIVILVVNVAIGMPHFFMTVFQCGNPKVGPVFFLKKYHGQCASVKIVQGIGLAFAIVNAVTDIILVALPIHVVWKSNIKRKDKWTLSVLFSIAASASILAIIRCAFIKELLASGPSFWKDSQGFIITSCLELTFAVIVGNLATMRPLYRHTRKSLRSYLSGSRSSKNTSPNRTTPSDQEKGRSNRGEKRSKSYLSAGDWNNKDVFLSASQEEEEKKKATGSMGSGALPTMAPQSYDYDSSMTRTMDSSKFIETGDATHGSFSPLISKQSDHQVPFSSTVNPRHHPIAPIAQPQRQVLPRRDTDTSSRSRTSWWNLGAKKESEQSRNRSNVRRKPKRGDSSNSGPTQLDDGYRRWVIRR